MRRRRLRRSRASVMTEFALILPFMLYMLAFSLDMGRMIYTAHAAQASISDAARQAAVFGAAGKDGTSNDPLIASRAVAVSGCNASTTDCQMALHALQQALSETPGGSMINEWTLTVVQDSSLKLGRVCSAATPALKLVLGYEVDWLAPGMDALLNINGGDQLTAMQFSTSVIARCEVELP